MTYPPALSWERPACECDFPCPCTGAPACLRDPVRICLSFVNVARFACHMCSSDDPSMTPLSVLHRSSRRGLGGLMADLWSASRGSGHYRSTPEVEEAKEAEADSRGPAHGRGVDTQRHG
jgi:hypothetical protein